MRRNCPRMQRSAALAFSALLLATFAGALAVRAAAPALPCTAASIAGAIVAVNRGAGHAMTTVALINHGTAACTLPTFPPLAFVARGRFVHLSVSRKRVNGENVVVPPGGSAALAFEWSDMAIGGGACMVRADALVGMPRGMPLWIPVGVDACLGMRQWPLVVSASAGSSLPDAAAAKLVFGRWFEAQPCHARLFRLTTMDRAAAPRVHDALNIPMARGTDFNTSGFAGQAFAAPVVLFDPASATVAVSISGPGIDVTLCGQNRSVPYGIALGALGGAHTKYGVHLGLTWAAVRRIEGSAPAIDLGSGYSALHYHWSSRGSNDLAVLFYARRAVALDYSLSNAARGVSVYTRRTRRSPFLIGSPGIAESRSLCHRCRRRS